MPLRPSTRPLPLGAIVALAIALGGCGSSAATKSTASSSSSASSSTASSPPASQTPSLLATTGGEATGQPVDGITCDTQEQVAYHIHAHLAIFVNGVQRIVPEGIGIAPPRQEEQSSEGPFVVAGSCFYWLHSHTPDGVIHIESPDQRVYTLGQYFDEWRQPLSATQVGPAPGKITAFVDGRPYSGDPRAIALLPHRQIQLDVGTPVVPPQPFTFPNGL
jgi:hypothetical protein